MDKRALKKAGAILAALIFLAVGIPYLLAALRDRAENRSLSELWRLREAVLSHVRRTGAPPKRLEDLVPHEIPAISRLKLPGTDHEPTQEARSGPSNRPTDSGAWLYSDSPRARDYGLVVVDCTHQDSRGIVWNSY